MYCELAVGASGGDLSEDGDDETQGGIGGELVEGCSFCVAWVTVAMLTAHTRYGDTRSQGVNASVAFFPELRSSSPLKHEGR